MFFFQNDDQVKRLPERTLSPLLLDLKQDMQRKKEYLKYLKVSTKFIEACSCDQHVHQYCLSAQVTKQRKIFCSQCGDHYKYWIKEEKICNSKLLKLIASYIVFFILVLLCTVGVMMIDGYLKLRKFQEGLEESGVQTEDVDTSVWTKVRWNVLIPVSAIVLLILVWCFYHTY